LPYWNRKEPTHRLSSDFWKRHWIVSSH
jgi:hypothetical protein